MDKNHAEFYARMMQEWQQKQAEAIANKDVHAAMGAASEIENYQIMLSRCSSDNQEGETKIQQ